MTLRLTTGLLSSAIALVLWLPAWADDSGEPPAGATAGQPAAAAPQTPDAPPPPAADEAKAGDAAGEKAPSAEDVIEDLLKGGRAPIEPTERPGRNAPQRHRWGQNRHRSIQHLES